MENKNILKFDDIPFIKKGEEKDYINIKNLISNICPNDYKRPENYPEIINECPNIINLKNGNLGIVLLTILEDKYDGIFLRDYLPQTNETNIKIMRTCDMIRNIVFDIEDIENIEEITLFGLKAKLNSENKYCFDIILPILSFPFHDLEINIIKKFPNKDTKISVKCDYIYLNQNVKKSMIDKSFIKYEEYKLIMFFKNGVFNSIDKY